MMPGGNPVIALPGLTPTLLVIVLAPVLVTVEAPSTAKFSAVPRDWAYVGVASGAKAARAAKSPGASRRRSDLVRLFIIGSNLLSGPPADPTGQTPGSFFKGHRRKLDLTAALYPGPERSNSGNPTALAKPALEL